MKKTMIAIAIAAAALMAGSAANAGSAYARAKSTTAKSATDVSRSTDVSSQRRYHHWRGHYGMRRYQEAADHLRQAVDNLPQHFGTDRSRFAFACVMRLKDGRGFLEARFVGRFLCLDRFHFLKHQLEPHLEFRFQARRFVFAQFSGVDQLLLKELRNWRTFLDFRVEIRLRE